MKKVILSAVVILIAAVSANAQTEKGKWLVGGTASFHSVKEGSSDAVTSLTLAPNAGYFVGNNFALGASVQLTTVQKESTAFAFAPFARYYFAPLGDNAKLFVNGTVGLGTFKSYQASSSTGFSTWELSAGPAFFINKNVALEIALAYGQNKFKNVEATKDFGLKAGFQIHLGK